MKKLMAIAALAVFSLGNLITTSPALAAGPPPPHVDLVAKNSHTPVRTMMARRSAHAIVNVEAPAISCVFNTTCTVMVRDSIGDFTPPGDSGVAHLQSRTFNGEPETAAAGDLAFEYRVNLSDVQSAVSQPNCVTRIAFDFGKPEPLPYNGVAAGLFDVFVVTRGGLGSVDLATETRKGRTITLAFSQPVCPGATSYFFGLTSRATAPVATTATLYYSLGGSDAVAVRVPQ